MKLTSPQALIIMLMIASCFHAQTLNGAEQEMKVTGKTAKTEINLLMESKKIEALKKTVTHWKNLKTKEKKQIVLELLNRLNSKRKLSLDPDAGVSVLDPNKKEKGLQKKQILQDIFMEAGRSAWALEQLFHFHIPQFHRTMNEKELAKASRTTMLAVIQIMRLPDFMNLTNASVEQRVRAARSHQTPLDVLGLLVKDPDPKVRLAVAEHPITPFLAEYKLLEEDKDRGVRKVAIKRANTIRGFQAGSEFVKYFMQFNFPSDVPE